jgi:hypothetical protein
MQPTIHQEENPHFYRLHVQGLRSNVLWVAFSISPGSLLLVKYPLYVQQKSSKLQIFFLLNYH